MDPVKRGRGQDASAPKLLFFCVAKCNAKRDALQLFDGSFRTDQLEKLEV